MLSARLVARPSGAVVIDGTGYPPAAVGGGTTGYLVELDSRGLIATHHANPGPTAWQQPGSSTAVRVYFDRELSDTAARLLLDWIDMRDGTVILAAFDASAHFAAMGACGTVSPNASAFVTPDDAHVWVIRTGCTGEHALHVIARDGSEPLGPAGISISAPLGSGAAGDVPGLPLHAATSIAFDGSLWIVTERAGTASDTQVGLRASRYAVDGRLMALSQVLVDPPLVLRQPATGGGDAPDGWGIWAEPDADGALLFHLGAHHPASDQLASHFARVAPDGSVAWRWTSPPGMGAFSDSLDSPIARDTAGGVFAALGAFSARTQLTVVHIDRDGHASPLDTADFISTEGLNVPGVVDPITFADVAPDDAGGFFLLARPLIPMLTHFDSHHVRTWPSSIGDPRQDPVTSFAPDPHTGLNWMQMEADAQGGVWIAENQGDTFTTFFQHIDRDGWPLFWQQLVSCDAHRRVLLRPSAGDMPIGFWETAWPREMSADVGIDAGSSVTDGGT